jgi:hypothetical protein
MVHFCVDRTRNVKKFPLKKFNPPGGGKYLHPPSIFPPTISIPVLLNTTPQGEGIKI